METDDLDGSNKRLCSGTPPSKLNKKSYKETCKFTINSLLSKPDRPYKTPPHHLINNGSLTSKRANTVFSFNDSPEKLIKLKSPHTLTAEVTKLYSPPHLEHTYQVSNVSTLRTDPSCKDAFVSKDNKKVRQPISCPTTPTRPTTAQLLYQRQINRQELQESRHIKDKQCKSDCLDRTQCVRKEMDDTKLKSNFSPVKSLPLGRLSPVESTEVMSPVKTLGNPSSSPIKVFQVPSPAKLPPTTLSKMVNIPLPALTDIPIPPPTKDEKTDSKLSYGKLSFFKKAISASLLDKASLITNGMSPSIEQPKKSSNSPSYLPKQNDCNDPSTLQKCEPTPLVTVKQNFTPAPPEVSVKQRPCIEAPEQLKPLNTMPEQVNGGALSPSTLQTNIYQTFIPPPKPKPQSKKRPKAPKETSGSPQPSYPQSNEFDIVKMPNYQNSSSMSLDVRLSESKKRKLSSSSGQSLEKRKKFTETQGPSLPNVPIIDTSQPTPTSASQHTPTYSVVSNILLQQKSSDNSSPLPKMHISNQAQPLSNTPMYREFCSKDGKLILRKEGSSGKAPKKSSNYLDSTKTEKKSSLNSEQTIVQMKFIESNAMLNISRDYADHKPVELTSHSMVVPEKGPAVTTTGYMKTEISEVPQKHSEIKSQSNLAKKDPGNEQNIRPSSCSTEVKNEGSDKRMKQVKHRHDKPQSSQSYKYSSESSSDEQMKARAKQKDLINGIVPHMKQVNDPLKGKISEPMKVCKMVNDPLIANKAAVMDLSINSPCKKSCMNPATIPTIPSKGVKTLNARPDKMSDVVQMPNSKSVKSPMRNLACSDKRVEKRLADVSARPSSRPVHSMTPKQAKPMSQSPKQVYPSQSPRPNSQPIAPSHSVPPKQVNPLSQCQRPNTQSTKSVPIESRSPHSGSKTPQKVLCKQIRQESKPSTPNHPAPVIKREKNHSGKTTPRMKSPNTPALCSQCTPVNKQVQSYMKAESPQPSNADIKREIVPPSSDPAGFTSGILPKVFKAEPEVAPSMIKSEKDVFIPPPKPTLSEISLMVNNSPNKSIHHDLIAPKTIGESSSAEPVMLCDPAKYVKIKKCNDGEATTVHLDMDEFNTLNIDEQNMLVDYFFEVTFGETDGFADNVMGVVHNGSEMFPNVLEHLAEYTPGLKIKHQVLGKKEIKTSTIKQYHESVQENFSTCVFHEGGLLQTSLVGTKNEESGGFFGDLIDQMDANPFMEAVVPWGTLTNFEGRDPNLSSDGPIFWVRPGEQFSRSTQTPRTHKGYRLLKSRETLIPDKTNPHADHSWEDGQTCSTTGAGAFLQAVHYGEGYNPDSTLKDVILFDSHNFHMLVNELQLDLYEPPMTQCDIWIEDAKLNHLQNLNVKYARMRLKSNDIYFIPRKVIHQFKTVRACASVAWHSRLKQYYE